MRIDGETPLDLLGPRFVLPGLRPGEEEALGAAQPVNFGRGRPLRARSDRPSRRCQSAEVANVLADRERAVDVLARRLGGRELVVLIDQRLGPLLEGLAVRLFPPVRQTPGAVELGPLVVEAVTDLVADDGADRAVVGGVVSLGAEERQLQDGRGKDDLVESGVVVGVYGLGRHEPLVTVDRRADLCQLTVELELARGADVRDEVVGVRSTSAE